ncbi:MAG: hypothetical protein LBJ84_03515 [Oscillospiraceae bacterium]|jgi:hypothetical protein|nr:hypothetical protein [Oscillospiraceae bacterium]
MAKISINIEGVLESLGATGLSPGAITTAGELEFYMGSIERTARKLDAVWDDEAQKVFIDSFVFKKAQVEVYLRELKLLLTRAREGAVQIREWDAELAGRLSDPYLGTKS